MSVDKLTSRAVIGMFYETLEQGAAGWADALSFPVNSDQASEEYAFLGMTPAFREMLGGRNAKGLREDAFTIRNKDWESTLKVKLKELNRDKSGQLRVRIAEHADRANSFWLSQLSTLIINGEDHVCYDGQYFFDTDHSEGDSGTLSNDLSIDISAEAVAVHGSTTNPSVEEVNVMIMKCIAQIYSFKDDQGEPINEMARKFMVMVPVSWWPQTVAALKNLVFASGVTNTIPNLNGITIEPVVNPRLTWTTKLAVFRTDGRTRPFIRQTEVPVEVSAVAEGSELEFNDREHHYGMYISGNVGYGMWQHACLATAA